MITAPQLRRLNQEYEELRALQNDSSMVRFTAHGLPPTRYDFEISCHGLALVNRQVIRVNAHKFSAFLENGFPFVAPRLEWLTDIFHPNISRPSVCLGDHWFPAWSLAELCVALIEMVQYKKFNIYDPLDREAAVWLAIQMELGSIEFPIDARAVKDQDFPIGGIVKNDPEGGSID